MNNFNLHTPTRILFGKDAIADLRAQRGGVVSLDRLLIFLAIDPSRVAVERNRAIARKADWPATRIEPGDQLEIVWFVGGG